MCVLQIPEIMLQETHIYWNHDQLNTLIFFTNDFCEINLILSSYFRPVGARIAPSVLSLRVAQQRNGGSIPASSEGVSLI